MTAGVAPRCRIRRHASLPSAKRLERVGRPLLGRRRRVQPQPGAGDDAERALRADEQLVQVGPDRGARRTAGGDRRARRRARRPGRRPCPRSSRSGCSSARRRGRRASRRRSTGRSTAASARASPRARRAACPRARCRTCRAARRGPSTRASIADDPAHRGQVEDDAAVQRHARAAHAAAARGRGDRDARLVAQREHRARPRPRPPAGRPPRPRAATWPSSDHTVVSGHQSRLASTTRRVVDEHRGARVAERRRSNASSSSTALAP